MAHITRYRDSVTGRLVTKPYALRNLKTTQKHRFPLPEDENPHKSRLGFLIEGFELAPAEDKAEWQLEIMEELTEWRKEDIAAAISGSDG